jgi:hypothetical protein
MKTEIPNACTHRANDKCNIGCRIFPNCADCSLNDTPVTDEFQREFVVTNCEYNKETECTLGCKAFPGCTNCCHSTVVPAPEKPSVVCSSCNAAIDPDMDEVFYTRDEDIMCYSCYESDGSYCSCVTTVSPDDVSRDYFTENFNHNCEACMDDEYPVPVAREKWVSTDGWRGYTVFEYLQGYVVLADGWVTGWPDTWMKDKMDLSVWAEKMVKGTLVPPVNVYFVTGRTSNVFSTVMDIVVHQDNKDELEKWMKSIGFTIENAQDGLR